MSRESWNKREWRFDPITLANGWVEVLDEEENPIVETGNVQVEFPWGNVPLQPNDDRTGLQSVNSGPEDVQWSPVLQQVSSTLNPALDNHAIATGLQGTTQFAGYNGYPGYLPGDNDNLPGSFVVPDVTGLTASEAINVLGFAGFDFSYVAVNNAGGATSENDQTVASQSPTAGHTIEEGGTVTINVYEYVLPQVFAWDLADWTGYAIQNSGWTFMGGNLMDAMVAATPSMGNNGWAGYKLRCTNAVLDNMGMPITITNGDYVITGSDNTNMGGPAAIVQVDLSTAFNPPISGTFNFASGSMAIIP